MIQTKKQIELDREQEEIVGQVVTEARFGRKMQMSIGGLAGTGKSTIAKAINKRLAYLNKNVITLCPTGKAANVLRSKGLQADTIHAGIYNFKGTAEDEEGIENPIFEKKQKIESRPDVIMVDEASMVNGRLYNDLMELKIPIIWIGDYGQLPPVGSDPKIMRCPDYVLQKNYRQGKSEIVDYALAVRQGYLIETHSDVVQIKNKKWSQIIYDFRPDQAIFGFNSSRVKYNTLYRRMNQFKGFLNAGEKIICLQNNRSQFIFNGMQFKVIEVKDENAQIVVADIQEIGTETIREVNVFKGSFNNEKYNKEELPNNYVAFDYAYGITCHKAQGSEWDSVLVFNQSCKAWDQQRWLYTAATRAAKHLMVVD